MSGFGFGGFDITAGLSGLTDLGEKLQKFKEEVENSIDASIKQDRFGFPIASQSESSTPRLAEQGDSDQAQATEASTSAPQLPATAEADSEAKPDMSRAPTLSDLLDHHGGVASPVKKALPVAEDCKLETIADESADEEGSKCPSEPITTSAKEEEKQAKTETKPEPDSEPANRPPPAEELRPPIPMESTSTEAGPSQTDTKEVPTTLSPDQPQEDQESVAIAVPEDGVNEPQQDQETSQEAEESIAHLDADALHKLVKQLKDTLQAREDQIERKSREMAELHTVTEQLKARNEELAMAKAKISEHDLAEIQRDFEGRLAATERKVYALSRERDALKREVGRAPDVEALLKEKDETIKQVLEEGEILSKKQLAQETTIKQLRHRVKGLKAEVEDYTARLETEQGKLAAVDSERAASVAELAAVREQHAAELSAERQHGERLLQEARAAQTVAEGQAATAMKQGLSKKLKDSEARVEALEATVADLRGELERQRAAADEREDLLSSEVSGLQRRCSEAEARQQELQSKVPEATAPLLRQLEAMQETASSQAAAWAAAERALQDRVATAEAALQVAQAQTAELTSSSHEVESRVDQLQQQVDQATARVQAAESAASEALKAKEAAERVASNLRSDLASAQESLSTLEAVYSQQMEVLQTKEAAADAKIRELEQQLGEGQGGQPPALAAPGFHWVLVKQGSKQEAAGAAATDNEASTNNSQYDDQQQSQAQSQEVEESTKYGLSKRDTELSPGDDSRPATHGNGNGNGNGGTTGPTLWGAGSMTTAASAAAGAANGLYGQVPTSSANVDRQIAALRALVADLEVTRDRLSEELVKSATEAAQGQAALAKVAALERDVKELQVRYAAAVELVGEKEERLEELQADLEDMRESYRRQIDALCAAPPLAS